MGRTAIHPKPTPLNNGSAQRRGKRSGYRRPGRGYRRERSGYRRQGRGYRREKRGYMMVGRG